VRLGARLRDVAGALEAPHGSRVRILEELSSDLEDLYATLRADGLTAEQARRRAELLLLPSVEAAAALEYVHRPLWLRLVERFSDRARHRLELALLLSMTVFMVVVTVAALAAAGLLHAPTPSLALIALIAGGAAAFVLVKAFAMHVGRARDAQHVRAGLPFLLVAGCASSTTALLGSLAGLYATAGRISGNPSLQAPLILEWLWRSVGAGALALLMALGCGVAWLTFMARAAAMDAAEARLKTLSSRRTS
jgi:hypothetical protein